MTGSIRVILFNADEAYAPELRRALTAQPAVKIVAELDEPSLLPQAVAQFPSDLVLLNLDPAPLVVLEVAAQVVAASPKLAVFAASASTEGDVLLRAMRAGIRRFLVKPIDNDDLRQGLEQIAADRSETEQPGSLISVMGSAGGVGATFVATNLAVELADLIGTQGKVALLDFDFRFGQVATMLDLEPHFTISDLCTTVEALDPAMIDKALVRHRSGVYVLARPLHFHHAESITAAHCASVMAMLQQMFDYVVIDGPTRSDPTGRTVLDAADHNLLVIQLLVPCVRNAARMIEELVSQGFNGDRIKLICNRTGRESMHLDAAQVERTLHRSLMHSLPEDWRVASTTVNLGQPLIQEFSRSRLRQSLRELAMKVHCPGEIPATSSGGLLSKLIKGMARTTSGAETSSAAVAPALPGAATT